MFITVTNAITGRQLRLSPNLIGMMEGREDDRHPNTHSVIILNDARGTFIPCRETVDQLFAMTDKALARPSVLNTRRPDPEGSPEER